MKTAFLAAAIALGICSPATAHFGKIQTKFETSIPPQHHRDYRRATQEYCLTLAIYFEGGSTAESEIGQRHIARVVHERARANQKKWGGSDICDAVFYMRRGVCQFTFACLPVARRTPNSGSAWQQAKSIAQAELDGSSELKERSIRYYMNTALTPLRNACRFRREFVKIVDAGRHEFFREPSPEERVELAKGSFTECERYAQQLKEQAAKQRKKLAAMKKKKPKSVKLAARPAS